ncbi:hypothetical protein [Planctomicrobium piriforme]|uniref:Uncharacterized protein n=1 Tax=Planctomicrobium piriforme TaxID=1576369 RepID=A0A1I3B7U0_9PLAN|nr:hypothetical protein [Planctomicrobium piriforme]SFH58292.1 hypothetical protein SAMN05421753_101287 [Planctomicrobium piriforme]
MIQVGKRSTDYELQSRVQYNMRAVSAPACLMGFLWFLTLVQASLALAFIAACVLFLIVGVVNSLLHIVSKPLVRVKGEMLLVVSSEGASPYEFRRPLKECRFDILPNGDISVRAFPWISDLMPGGSLPSRMILTAKAADRVRWEELARTQMEAATSKS